MWHQTALFSSVRDSVSTLRLMRWQENVAVRVSNQETKQVLAWLKNGMASIQAEGMWNFIMIGCLLSNLFQCLH